ncbi:uncharacterized protein LOC122527378 isoform X1 [Frieseomelitta varia]|uniref:uncharacterized protein LOC122527378 isoform X1 n=1 Tax=Frieseomelitta varia TaxID=561572 RepID=UPI001CB687DC|nr:uncharacterized protein LOC122527378 isoform X1 [Frieseomelitta varia]XP_043507432.1 uncharacterized protein LOC122527378 isoform X1 [Frieseomelitta varia]
MCHTVDFNFAWQSTIEVDDRSRRLLERIRRKDPNLMEINFNCIYTSIHVCQIQRSSFLHFTVQKTSRHETNDFKRVKVPKVRSQQFRHFRILITPTRSKFRANR